MSTLAAMEHDLTTSREACQVHETHRPHSHLNHHHHVWPLSLGGPNVPDNVVVTCPTGHYNIHSLLDQYLHNNGKVPWSVVRRYTYGEREYAKLGYDRHVRGSL